MVLRREGSNSPLPIPDTRHRSYRASFERSHQREFGCTRPTRGVRAYRPGYCIHLGNVRAALHVTGDRRGGILQRDEASKHSFECTVQI